MEWEYSVGVEQPWGEMEAMQENLREAGRDGWELVSAVYHPERAVMLYFFKRPKRRVSAGAQTAAVEALA